MPHLTMKHLVNDIDKLPDDKLRECLESMARCLWSTGGDPFRVVRKFCPEAHKSMYDLKARTL